MPVNTQTYCGATQTTQIAKKTTNENTALAIIEAREASYNALQRHIALDGPPPPSRLNSPVRARDEEEVWANKRRCVMFGRHDKHLTNDINDEGGVVLRVITPDGCICEPVERESTFDEYDGEERIADRARLYVGREPCTRPVIVAERRAQTGSRFRKPRTTKAMKHAAGPRPALSDTHNLISVTTSAASGPSFTIHPADKLLLEGAGFNARNVREAVGRVANIRRRCPASSL